MSYEISTTQIADLPTGNNDKIFEKNSFLDTIKTQKMGIANTTYQNLNVHPNPFIPESSFDIQSDYPLPSRDIPQNPHNYNIAPEIKVNYIPEPPLKIEDYLKDTEIITNKRIKKHQEKQKRKAYLIDILSDFQFTIYLSLLFLIFNLPVINILLLHFLGRFDLFFYPDGNINFYGLLIKSAIFGSVYYLLQKGVDWIVI
jgi:hypothetical protein